MSSPSLISAYSVPRRQHVATSYFFVHMGERISASLMLLMLLPCLICVAAAIGILSGRSPLVAHRRVGQYGQPFWILKFRTMWPCGSPAIHAAGLVEYLAGESARGETKAACDPRVTSRFAAFCRRYSIDELPQLWHVIHGAMSYVGPRPLTVPELEEFYGEDAVEILAHKPGISGLWQVTGRSRLSYAQRKRLDLHLVRHQSLSLYFAVLARTVPAVLRGKSAW